LALALILKSPISPTLDMIASFCGALLRIIVEPFWVVFVSVCIYYTAERYLGQENFTILDKNGKIFNTFFWVRIGLVTVCANEPLRLLFYAYVR
jgi:hypothetical protein